MISAVDFLYSWQSRWRASQFLFEFFSTCIINHLASVTSGKIDPGIHWLWICLWYLTFFFPYRACYGVLRFVMESGAKGCEVLYDAYFLWICYFCSTVLGFDAPTLQVIVSGKLRAQRAKSMKFKDGYMISSGQPVNEYIDSAVRHVLLRQVGFSFLALCSTINLKIVWYLWNYLIKKWCLVIS